MSPAWKSWELPEPGTSVTYWRCGECAMCGRRWGTVMDHCHETGLIRGLLCTGCNTSEGTSSAKHWNAWREWDNPARALNSVEVYRVGIGVPTPISVYSDFVYLTRKEREAWWAEQAEAAATGKDWPTALSVDVQSRRDAEWKQLHAEMASAPTPLGRHFDQLLGGKRNGERAS